MSDERSAICIFLLSVESQPVQVVYGVAGRTNACLLLCVPAAENNTLSFSIGCMTSTSVVILDNRNAYESHALVGL